MEVASFHMSRIIIDPDRQRKDLGNLDELAASIKEVGQLQPIIVTEVDNYSDTDPFWKLIAGERRFRAHEKLGLDTIFGVFRSELTPAQQELIELEENIKRKQLNWPEYIEGVYRYHAQANNGSATQAEIAMCLGIPETQFSRMLRLAEALPVHGFLSQANSWTAAYQGLVDREKKESDSLLADILGDDNDDPLSAPLVPVPAAPALVGTGSASNSPAPVEGMAETATAVRSDGGDGEIGAPTLSIEPAALPTIAHPINFIDWAAAYSGRPFNLIHCDFPYGLDMGGANLQASSVRWEEAGGRYQDDEEYAREIFLAFTRGSKRFMADNCHVVFWLAHKFLPTTMRIFANLGWDVCEVPLIWHKSGGEGIAPDVRRQPRRTYEIALFATRGDRRIAKVKAASISAALTKNHHLSEKPLEVVTHFLEMLVDDTTEILDPTCGSGTALEAAITLGCKRAIGFDLNPAHVAVTNSRCHAALNRRKRLLAAGAASDDLIDGLIADL